MYNVSRKDIKKLASQIENLSKEIRRNIDKGIDFLDPASELVKNTSVLVFALGEVYAFEQVTPKAKVVSPKKLVPRNRTYLRDAWGRFARKV